MNRIYTGVGSRETPPDVLRSMTELAGTLARNDIFLRTGGANGADSAFEAGAKAEGNRYQLYLPEPGFNGREGFAIITRKALAMAARYHPAWQECSRYVRKLHARNAYQVLDIRLDNPSDFVVCWTPDGAVCHAERSQRTGGTGTAISIASEHGVPVFNLQREASRTKLVQFLKDTYGLTVSFSGQQAMSF